MVKSVSMSELKNELSAIEPAIVESIAVESTPIDPSTQGITTPTASTNALSTDVMTSHYDNAKQALKALQALIKNHRWGRTRVFSLEVGKKIYLLCDSFPQVLFLAKDTAKSGMKDNSQTKAVLISQHAVPVALIGTDEWGDIIYLTFQGNTALKDSIQDDITRVIASKVIPLLETGILPLQIVRAAWVAQNAGKYGGSEDAALKWKVNPRAEKRSLTASQEVYELLAQI